MLRSRASTTLAVCLVGLGLGLAPEAPGDDLRWLDDARLGLAVPWGVDSLVGRGHWLMEEDRLPVLEYEKLPPHFDPAGFDADRWADAAVRAGARSLTVTAKNPDGFCLFGSAETRYDVVDATPFGRDPLRDLAEACRRRGLKLILGYSLLDWHHPDYLPTGRTGRGSRRESSGDWPRYLAYCRAQLRELCTAYGPIGGIQLEGTWDRPMTDWDLPAAIALIRGLQPDALIGLDDPDAVDLGADYQIVEPDAPEDRSRPRVLAIPVGRSRGYVARDPAYRPAEELVRLLVEAAGRGVSLHLGLAAGPDGALPSGAVEELQALGRWLEAEGASIRGTRPGPIGPAPWGVSTRSADGQAIYLHVLRPELPVVVPEVYRGWSARVRGNGRPLSGESAEGGFRLDLPPDARRPIDTVVELTRRVRP